MAVLVCAAAAAAAAAGAQDPRDAGYHLRPVAGSVTLSGGLALPNARGGIYDFSYDRLTMRPENLAGIDGDLDLGFHLGSRVDLIVGIGKSVGLHRSETRDFVDQDDRPIEQTTRLARTPIGLGLRYHLTPRGRRIGTYAWVPAAWVPWLGVDAGVLSWRFAQRGDFVNEENLEIFSSSYGSDGFTPYARLSLGSAWNLSARYALTGTLRYLAARPAELGPDFRGFEPINLSGFSTGLGLTRRF